MNDTAVLTNAPSCEGPETKPDGAKRALPVTISFSGKKPLSATWPLGLAAAAVLGPLAAGLASWRRAWVCRLKSAEEECRAKTAEGAAWQSQLDDSRRTEEVVAKALAEART